jgi:hypothetical protein
MGEQIVTSRGSCWTVWAQLLLACRKCMLKPQINELPNGSSLDPFFAVE